MEYIPLENLLSKCANSVYKLVILASRRGLEIAEGQPKLVETKAGIKPSAVALYEVASGKIECRVPKKEG
jgi:DNA-directed RNA polymerase omega subunit